jgi:hypothetical protein
MASFRSSYWRYWRLMDVSKERMIDTPQKTFQRLKKTTDRKKIVVVIFWVAIVLTVYLYQFRGMFISILKLIEIS